MLPLYHATGVLVLPKPQKSSHVFPTPKGEKERGGNISEHVAAVPQLIFLRSPKATSLYENISSIA